MRWSPVRGDGWIVDIMASDADCAEIAPFDRSADAHDRHQPPACIAFDHVSPTTVPAHLRPLALSSAGRGPALVAVGPGARAGILRVARKKPISQHGRERHRGRVPHGHPASQRAAPARGGAAARPRALDPMRGPAGEGEWNEMWALRCQRAKSNSRFRSSSVPIQRSTLQAVSIASRIARSSACQAA